MVVYNWYVFMSTGDGRQGFCGSKGEAEAEANEYIGDFDNGEVVTKTIDRYDIRRKKTLLFVLNEHAANPE